MNTVLATLASRPSTLQGLPTLVTDVREFEDLQLALQQGVDYVCGALSVSLPTRPSGQTLSAPPEVKRIGQLLNLLVKGADNAALVDQIKSDVGLSVRLLQRINTASFAHLEINGSIEQAVMLGRSELYRWLSMLLFSSREKAEVPAPPRKSRFGAPDFWNCSARPRATMHRVSCLRWVWRR